MKCIFPKNHIKPYKSQLSGIAYDNMLISMMKDEIFYLVHFRKETKFLQSKSTVLQF